MKDVLNDLTGQKFGRLTVVQRAEDRIRPNGKHRVQWLCKCDCGNYSVVDPSSLHSGNTSSCGCLKKEMRGEKHWNFTDLTGMTFGRLTVVSKSDKIVNYGVAWNCKCECGKETVVTTHALKSGGTQSCGCGRGGQIKHGKSKTRLYGVWCGMIRRCEETTNPAYRWYGAKGVKVCEEWRRDFQKFFDWSMENGYDENAPRGICTLDRINPYGNYEPNNCRWADWDTQVNNRRDFDPADHPFAKKVIRLDDMKIYDSIQEAANDVGVCRSRITAACQKIQNTSGGYHWAFYNVGDATDEH